jgi:uncharacterized membrane protein
VTSNKSPAADSAAAPDISRNQILGLLGVLLAYAALSHYSESSPDAKGLAAGLSVGPVMLIAIALAWRWAHPLGALLTAAVLGGTLYRYWPLVKNEYQWGDLLQQGGIYTLVAVSFARSMLGGRVPVCTQLAERIHGELTPIEISYTRHATLAWTVFYGLLTTVIVALFFWTPLKIWSLFVNFGTFGLIVLMATADHALRRRLLPRHPGGGLKAILQRALFG